ncbi:hypothetical protein MLD38_029832 [Melastoma candidum]|uniref:Uncharacterized protein n=1 Tax=Melastoma candidum TaxID=119954 RepID=A0ACB9N7C5_9MYRT|nr:hypothetical protein MLD38_029832 [Melastoma candidum]
MDSHHPAGGTQVLESIWFGGANGHITNLCGMAAHWFPTSEGDEAGHKNKNRRDFTMENEVAVLSSEIWQGIRALLEESREQRRKMEELRDISRNLLKERRSCGVR